LVEESTQNLDLPEVIPETCEDAVNDACTETSSSDVSENEDDRSGFERTGCRKFEPPVAQKVSQCGSTPSQRYCILGTAGHPTSSSVAEDRVPFTRRRACDPDGTVAYAGSVSSIGRAGTHVIDLYLPFCNFSFKFH
jgi:hypothetical protein